MGAVLVVLMTAAGGPSVRFEGPTLTCPTHAEIEEGLRSFGISVADAAPITVVVDVAEGSLNLWVGLDPPLERQLSPQGNCAERAIQLAAVIDRIVRPVWESEGSTEIHRGPGTETDPVGGVEADRDPGAEAENRTATVAEGDPSLSALLLASGVFGLVDSLVWTAGVDVDLRFRTALSWVLVRVGWRPGRATSLGLGSLRIDEVDLAVGARLGPAFDWESLDLEAAIVARGIRAEPRGFSVDQAIYRLNPGVTAALCYGGDGGVLWLEGCLRGLVNFLAQDLRAGGASVRLPRVGLLVTVGGGLNL